MDKLIYNKHDWSTGEKIEEKYVDSIENGIDSATKKINILMDSLAPLENSKEIDECKINIWGKVFDTLKQSLDENYYQMVKSLNIYRFYTYSTDRRNNIIENTAESQIINSVLKGRTINGKSAGEDEGYLIIKTNTVSGGDIYEECIREILVPKGGLKSIGNICDAIEQRDGKVYLTKRISYDGLDILEEPIEKIIGKDLLNLKTYENQTRIESTNKIQPNIEFSYMNSSNERVDVNNVLLIDNAKEGKRTSNLKIKGKSYYNLAYKNFLFNSLDNSKFTTILNEDSIQISKNDKLSQYKILVEVNKFMFKIDTNYTLFLDCALEGVSNLNITSIGVYDENNENVIIKKENILMTNGINKIVFTVPNSINISNQKLYIEVADLNSIGFAKIGNSILGKSSYNFTVSKLMILEGDLSNVFVPQYINGLESVSENENNEIVIFSHNENSVDSDRKRISLPIEGGLKFIPNGICDIIEQREDNVYLIQKIKQLNLKDLNWELQSEGENTFLYGVNIPNTKISNDGRELTSNLYQYQNDLYLAENDIVGMDIVDKDGMPRLNIRVRKSDLESKSIESLKKYLTNINAKVYCELENYIEYILDIDDPSIEDPILVLNTYIDQTELKMENNICPIFEGSVSISLVSKIDKNRESNEEIKEQISTLESDLDIINENIEENNNEQMANDLDLDMRILELELMKDL